MTFSVLGMIGVAPPPAESQGAAVHVIGGGVDPDYIVRFTEAHEQAGFDAVLVGYSSASADGFTVASFAAAHTDRISFLVAHRPGFIAPTLAARKAATLDNLTRGRLQLHIITGGVDYDQRRDGDFLGHDERYARTDEYISVLKQTWTSAKPFDFEGRYYRFEQAVSEVRCHQQPHIPVYFGGVSPAAIGVGARHADVYALFGESRANVTEMMQTITRAAALHERQPAFQLSFRPIIAETEGKAWDKAASLLAQIKGAATRKPEAETAKRLLRLAAAGEVHDERLWTPLAAAAGGSGNTTALVGTPAQVADAILAYYDLGVRGVLIRGFDPLSDAREYGVELIPRIRAGVATRESALVRSSEANKQP